MGNITRRGFAAAMASGAALASTACGQSGSQSSGTGGSSSAIERKIAQMIMPAIRTWEGEDNGVTDLSAVPKLAEALRKHQYGGVILFGANVVDADQTVRLVHDLQVNNAQSADAQATGLIPYFIAADQEGGSVARLSMGTRGTGSMAIGATGDTAEENALKTGRIFGQELSALGINVNLGPCIDVITDLADQGMSTRVFSDDPELVECLGKAFAAGVGESGVITCFKHFPGAGDGSDYPTAISITREELEQQGLIPYAGVINDGADMVMISATTFPSIDDEHVLADGKTKGYYPASMSPKIVGTMLREELGFEGVVMTDALEMDQFFEEPETGDRLLPGEKYSVEWAVAVAQKCIEAGCDILLIPTDLDSVDSIAWFDEYIAGIAALVEKGTLDGALIDRAVERIYALKQKCGLMELDPTQDNLDEVVATAQEVVGADEHHAIERDIAEQAVTLLKDDGVLPVPLENTSVVILGRTFSDAIPIGYALSELMENGALDSHAFIDNRITEEASGDKASSMRIYIDRYFDLADGGTSVYTDEISAAIAKAQYVICLSAISAGIEMLQDDEPRVQGVSRALSEAHKAKAKFVLLSDNIPVEAARYPEADAVVCAYLSAGFDTDPTTGSGSENMRAINANVPAALRAIFGAADMPGELPINIYALAKDSNGVWSYTDELIYSRGFSPV